MALSRFSRREALAIAGAAALIPLTGSDPANAEPDHYEWLGNYRVDLRELATGLADMDREALDSPEHRGWQQRARGRAYQWTGWTTLVAISGRPAAATAMADGVTATLQAGGCRLVAKGASSDWAVWMLFVRADAAAVRQLLGDVPGFVATNRKGWTG